MTHRIEQTATFAKWFGKLRDVKGRTIIGRRLDRFAFDGTGDTKALGFGLHELRVHVGPGYRVYFCFRDDDTVLLLLVGGDKGTQERDIDAARSIMKELE